MDGARHYVVEGVPGKAGQQPEQAPEVLQGHAARAPWASFLTPSQIAEAHRRAHCIERLRTFSSAAVDVMVELTLRYRSAQQFSGVAIYRCASRGLRSRDALLAEAAAAHGLPPMALET